MNNSPRRTTANRACRPIWLLLGIPASLAAPATRATDAALTLECTAEALVVEFHDPAAVGDSGRAQGGLVAVSPHSAVGIRSWFRVMSTY
ncbi:MAG: hypothetical protein HZA93_09115 [Verrucomicrobia bacterium]|nr:hypothetical protein [Verrucomicrobiota bacterium]